MGDATYAVPWFVAGFIGSPRINLVRPATLRIPEAMMRGRADVVIGVRPEDIFVGAGVALERVHFFDPRTKKRIPG